MVECEIRIDNLDAVAGMVDGVHIKETDNVATGARFTVYDTHRFLATATGGIRFQSLEIAMFVVVAMKIRTAGNSGQRT